MTKDGLLNKIKAHMKVIGKERDALRELIDDAESVLTSCDEAYASLEAAVESLSQYL
jgi:hypothetical protein